MVLRPPRSTRTSTLFPYSTGFRSQAVEAGRVDPRLLAEDRRIGIEPDGGAAPVLHRRSLAELGGRLALAVALRVELLVACHLARHPAGPRVHHRHADAVPAAGGRVGLRPELGPRVQRGEAHLALGFRLSLW